MLLNVWLRMKAPSSERDDGEGQDRRVIAGRRARLRSARVAGLDPGGEDLGRGQAERLVRARHLERDGGDRAGHGEVGGLQGPGRAVEHGGHAAQQVGGIVPDGFDQRLVPGSRRTDGCHGQLVLAPGEVVVERGVRRTGLGQDLLDPGSGQALALEQRGARLDEAISCVVPWDPPQTAGVP